MMKKNSEVKAEEKTAPQYGFRKMRPVKVPRAAWFALAVSIVMAGFLFFLYFFSVNGADNAGRKLLIYSDGSDIPLVSLRNSLASADFSFEVIGPDKRISKPDYVFELPDRYRNDKVVVCALGRLPLR